MYRIGAIAISMLAFVSASCRSGTPGGTAETAKTTVASDGWAHAPAASPDDYVPRRPIGYWDAATRPDLAIRAEVERLGPDHEWAGVYVSADCRATLMIAPSQGCYIREWGGCLGPSENLDWGRAEFVDGRIHLVLERQTRGYEVFDTEYTVEGFGITRVLRDREGHRFTLEGQPIKSEMSDLLEPLYPK